MFWWIVDWIWLVRVVERALRRASFSGFGGIGGAAGGFEGVGRGMSRGELRRSGVR